MMRVLRYFGFAAGIGMLLQAGTCVLQPNPPLSEQISNFAVEFARQVLAAAVL